MVLASTVLKWIPGSQDREDEIIKIYREHKTKRLSRGGTSTQLGDVDMHHKPSILNAPQALYSHSHTYLAALGASATAHCLQIRGTQRFSSNGTEGTYSTSKKKKLGITMEEKQGFFAPGQNTVQIYSMKDD